jgi:hypothetical protein
MSVKRWLFAWQDNVDPLSKPDPEYDWEFVLASDYDEMVAALQAHIARLESALRTANARLFDHGLEQSTVATLETNCKPCSDARSQGQEDTVEQTHPKATDQVGTVSVSGADKQPISPTFQAKIKDE